MTLNYSVFCWGICHGEGLWSPLFKLVVYSITKRHWQFFIYMSVGFLKGAFVVFCIPSLWPWRVICVCVVISSRKALCLSLQSSCLCPQSLISAAQAVSPSFFPNILLPSLPFLSFHCLLFSSHHTYSLNTDIRQSIRDRQCLCVCVREGSLHKMTGFFSSWKMKLVISYPFNRKNITMYLCLSSAGGSGWKKLRLFGGKHKGEIGSFNNITTIFCRWFTL